MQAMASGREESDYDSSCSSFTAPDSRRSWISDASLACSSTLSVRSSGDAAAHKPHKATQAEWEAIRSLRASAPGGHVGLDHFRLVRRLGSGDLGNVYLCRLRSPSPSPLLFAMKVVDRDALAFKKKLQRAETEREILRSLDHPFLPTLYAEFDASRYSCFVMEFCPGGDLHAARQRLPSRRFSLSSAKFYAAETILAIEYLHMMGVVYRDLKPENVLVRDDGHIMLSDFDLSLKCDVVPKLLKQRLAAASSGKSSSSSSGSCVPPMQYCFSRSGSKKSKPRPSAGTCDDDDNDDEDGAHETELVAEPVSARSKSFVGTHEYLAPEVISGAGHGSAVDWWTLGVFLYEMMYGRTPFKGEDNERTLTNIVKQPLSFPRLPAAVSAREAEEVARAQDLVGKLLVKNPKRRMGCVRGSVEIKRHEFFRGVNWALIRSVRPPEVPRDLRRVKCRAAAEAAAAAAALPVQRLSRKQREEPFKMHQYFDYF